MSPVKYPSLSDETDEKNFFPITWRVIGGGVRVGVVKESNRNLILNDNGNVFENMTPHKPSGLPPLKLPCRKRSNSIPSTPSNTLFNVEQVRYFLFAVSLHPDYLYTSFFLRNLPVSCRKLLFSSLPPLSFGGPCYSWSLTFCAHGIVFLL